MKIFLDVGAHTGQTLTAAQRWGFDLIICFEPVKENVAILRELADKRTVILPFGLWNKTARMPIYDPGSQGGSLWKRPGRKHHAEQCEFVRVSDWLRERDWGGAEAWYEDYDGAEVWMKINAEGAELDIITDMLDTGTFNRITYLKVMWDAHKIPAVAARLAGVKARLVDFKPPRVMDSKQVKPAKTHVARIDNWLAATGLQRP